MLVSLVSMGRMLSISYIVELTLVLIRSGGVGGWVETHALAYHKKNIVLQM